MRFGREELLLTALVLTSWAAADNLGSYSPLAFGLIAGAVLVALVALRGGRRVHAGAMVWSAALALLAAANMPLAQRILDINQLPAVPMGVAAMVLVVAVSCAMAPVPVLVRRGALALAGGALVWLVALAWHWGWIGIDVFAAVTNAGGALLHGHNPYSASFPVLVWTWPETFHWSTASLQYGPMVAVLAVPGHLAGDVRLSNALGTIVLVAAVWALARRSSSPVARIGAPLAAAVMPFTLGMVIEGWVDVFMMAGFTGWLVLRRRHPRLAVLCLATCLLVKPTIGVALLPPFVWLRSARREGLAACAIAAAVLVPLAAVTGPAALWHDLSGVLTSLPPRADGLTLISDLYRQFGILLPTVVGTALTGLAAVALLVRPPADMSDLMARAAALSLVAFALAKWAFFNYYYVSAVLLVLALAAQGMELDPEDVALPIPTWLWARQSTTYSQTASLRGSRIS